jgi:hypothetical protein
MKAVWFVLAWFLTAQFAVAQPGENPDDHPVIRPKPGGWQPPETPKDDTYMKTVRRDGANHDATIGYVIVGVVGLSVALVYFFRETKQTLALRRKQPWDR